MTYVPNKWMTYVLTTSKERNLPKIGNGDKVSRKLRQYKSMCKEIEKDECEIFLNRNSVCQFLGKNVSNVVINAFLKFLNFY